MMVDGAFMDFSKAFDEVSHARLIQKIRMHGLWLKGNIQAGGLSSVEFRRYL